MDDAAGAARIALLAGATGLVGRELLRLLLACPSYARVHVLLRRAVPGLGAHPRLVAHQVDFARLPEAFPRVGDAYIALGTTIKVAGSPEAFRRVDLDFVVNTARAARAAGATRLAVVSALGADAASRAFYIRVKGEMQEAVTQLGYASVVIAQPSLLLGDRVALGQPARSGEAWAVRLLGPLAPLVPAGVRPIPARAVAAALLAAMLDARPGVRLLASRAMQAYRAPHAPGADLGPR
jgi:uncharacterized protein YbjT (DUF2867 family)